MTNGQITKAFLATVGTKTKALVLNNIAKHYGIDCDAVVDEVTSESAEHLLDYVTGPERGAVHIFMQQLGYMAKTA